jgi:hypothetical protein
MFDLLLLLSKGYVIYFGPAKDATKYFQQSPFKFVFEESNNAGDFVVSIAGNSLPDGEGRIPSTKALNRYYTHSQADIDAIEIMEASECDEMLKENFVFELFSVYPSPRLYQLYILTARYISKTLRNRKPVYIGFLRHLLIGLLYGI